MPRKAKPKRKAPKRKAGSIKRKAPKRKAPKRKAPKRKAGSIKRKAPKRKAAGLFGSNKKDAYGNKTVSAWTLIKRFFNWHKKHRDHDKNQGYGGKHLN